MVIRLVGSADGCIDGIVVCFFKQKTAYEMRISDWSSDVCSSDLGSAERASRAARKAYPCRSMESNRTVIIEVIRCGAGVWTSSSSLVALDASSYNGSTRAATAIGRLGK